MVSIACRWTRAYRFTRDIVSAAGCGAAADIITQGLEAGEDASWDYRRTAAFAAFTGGYVGGAGSFLYAAYPRVATWLLRAKDTTSRNGAVCSALDNFLHVPFAYIPAYYMSTGLMRGHESEASLQTLRDSWTETVTSCWLFWIPAQYVIFSRVPLSWRVRAVAFGDFAWNVALSFISNRGLRVEASVVVPKLSTAASGETLVEAGGAVATEIGCAFTGSPST